MVPGFAALYAHSATSSVHPEKYGDQAGPDPLHCIKQGNVHAIRVSAGCTKANALQNLGQTLEREGVVTCTGCAGARHPHHTVG